MKDIKSILVVSRMPEVGQKALDYGAALSKQSGAELYIMNVIYDPFLRGDWNLPIPLGTLEDEYRKMLEESSKKLGRIVSGEKKKGMRVTEIAREGRPTEEIIKFVAEKNIDLLIMPAHREGRLEHLLFGRSNEDIIRNMPCSILLVKEEPEPVKF